MAMYLYDVLLDKIHFLRHMIQMPHRKWNKDTKDYHKIYGWWHNYLTHCAKWRHVASYQIIACGRRYQAIILTKVA